MAFTVGEASSSSASGSNPRYTSHAFLSFRGEDTRKGFTSHLFAALERKGIKTFKDDNDLDRGQVIKPELLKAIEESMFAVIVLSPNYASSTWCLDELRRIVDCNNTLGLQIVPIFFGVEPSYVRHQKGSFAEAFKTHEENFRHDTEKVKRWRDALTQVANFSGWDSKDRDEAAFIEGIVEHIHKKLIPKLPSSTENLVGISSRVEEVTSLIGMGNEVRFIGIWGMGGIGKTTTARVVYELIQHDFKVSCFLANIREVSETKGLLHLQKELLSCLNIRSSDFLNLFDGQKAIRNSLCNKKVLLVLDDVSEVSQLQNLAEKQDWFGPGSRIIITTRNMRPLTIHEVHETYAMKGLAQPEALHLFCLKAFKRGQPDEGYLDLSKQVVEYTGCLPLALEVLGSYLYKRSIVVWHSALSKVRNDPNSDIKRTLKISYDSLDQNEKNIFLDIACFFKRVQKDKVIAILENCGHNPEIVIDDLIERSLVTLDQKINILGMHDLLEEMGRHIVFQESPNDPSKRSRLWSQEDIDHVLTQNKGTEKIQSIVVKYTGSYEACWSTEAFSKMSQLKFLSIDGFGMQLPLGLNCLPSSLKVLEWEECPLKTLPLTNQPNEVVRIELCGSKIGQPWHGTKFLEKLKYMDLSYSWNLKQLPDFSGVPNLETLLLTDCTSLTEVHRSLLCHKKLVLLDLEGCESLEAFPSKLEICSLKELVLDHCLELKLPGFGECMEHLSVLSLRETAITKLPTSLGCLVGLAKLDLKYCKELVSLPDTICRLKSLKYLDISYCWKLCRLPEGINELKCLEQLRAKNASIEELPSFSEFGWYEGLPYDCSHLSLLEILDLSGNNFVSLPCGISKLPKLAYLGLNECQKLQLLPELPQRIRVLAAWNCHSLESFKFNPSKLCSLLASPVQPWQFPEDADDDDDDDVEWILADCKARFEMLITGSEIPSWFVCLPLTQENVNDFSAKIPLPLHWLRNEWVGIAFCFQLVNEWKGDFLDCYLHITNQLKPFKISNDWIHFVDEDSPHLYFLYLSIDEFCDKIPKDGHWSEFEIELNCSGGMVRRCGYRLIYKQDVEKWNGQSSNDLQGGSMIFGADDTVGLSQKRRRMM